METVIGWTGGVRIPLWVTFSLLHSTQTISTRFLSPEADVLSFLAGRQYPFNVLTAV
jgi:hypothetical protein